MNVSSCLSVNVLVHRDDEAGRLGHSCFERCRVLVRARERQELDGQRALRVGGIEYGRSGQAEVVLGGKALDLEAPEGGELGGHSAHGAGPRHHNLSLIHI